MDGRSFDILNIERCSSGIYLQQAANLNNSDRNVDFIFGESKNNYRIGNACLQFDLTMNTGVQFQNDNSDINSFVKFAFAHLFKEATKVTTIG